MCGTKGLSSTPLERHFFYFFIFLKKIKTLIFCKKITKKELKCGDVKHGYALSNMLVFLKFNSCQKGKFFFILKVFQMIFGNEPLKHEVIV